MIKQRKQLGNRPKAFWGAIIPSLISSVANITSGIITTSAQARAQKRALEQQQQLAQQQAQISRDNQLANTLNNSANADASYDNSDQYNLKYRNGGVKRIGSNNIVITDGGNAKKIGQNTYLLRGGSHETINETGQTGIGINVGGNEIEAEGGEVAQKKGNALRIFSAQPILNGISPAQAVKAGVNKDSVFNAQQRFKKNNGLKDDGSKAAFGDLITMPDIGNRIVEYFTGTGRYARKPIKVSNKTVAKKSIRNGQSGNFRLFNGRHIPNENPLRQVYPEFDIISMGRGLPIEKAAKATAKAAKNEVNYINRISKSRLYSNNPIVNTYATYARRYNLPDKARVPYMIRRVKSDELPSINNGRIKMSGDRFNHTNFTYDRPVVSHRKGKWDTAQQTYLVNGRTLVSKNKGNWGSIEPSDMFTIKDPKGGLTVPTKDVVLVSGHKGLLSKAKDKGIKIATNPQLQAREASIAPRGKIGRFDFSEGERRHYNTPYWIDVNNIVKEYGTPKLKDVKLLEDMTGLKSGVSSLDNNAVKLINDANRFDKLTLDEAERVMNQTYPNGRSVNFINDREAYITGQLPYNNLFYDPTTHAESNYIFPKRLGGLTSKDRGSSKHPYPSVASNNFAGNNRTYPIPTKADAIDALRLAGLHGRSDVRSKVYNKYPELRKKAKVGIKADSYYDWAKNVAANLDISLIDPTYDYRAYYNSVTPYERNLIRYALQGTHFTDIGKTSKHPTFSNESKYSNKKTPGGTWNGNVFVPAIWQFANDGNKVRNRYMKNSGEGYFDGRKDVFPKYKFGGKAAFGGIRPKALTGMLATPKLRNNISVPNPYRYSFEDIDNNSFLKNQKSNGLTTSSNYTPYIGRQSEFVPATQDYIGLGIDTLATLGSGLFTRSAYNNLDFDYNLPNYVDETPVAFDTTYHNEAQRANIERNRINARNTISGNTASAQNALNRMQQSDTSALMETNKLLDEKSNKEVELRNQNAANEQAVRARNAAARNQYYQNVASIKNAALEAKNEAALAKAQSISSDLSGLSQAWTNFATSVENRYNNRQNEAIIAATSKEPAVLSNALQFGYNFSPEILANIYRSSNNDKLKRLALSRLSNSERRKFGIV